MSKFIFVNVKLFKFEMRVKFCVSLWEYLPHTYYIRLIQLSSLLLLDGLVSLNCLCVCGGGGGEGGATGKRENNNNKHTYINNRPTLRCHRQVSMWTNHLCYYHKYNMFL